MEETIERKKFLELLGLGIMSVSAGGFLFSRLANAKGGKKENGKRYAMAIDLRRCVGCMACAVACKAENRVSLGGFRAWVKYVEKGEYPLVRKLFLPRLCNHCDDAPCVRYCPTKASYRREDGVVLIRKERCIGCKTCISACPYGSRYIIPETGIADKCTFCIHRVDKGIVPACVATCIGRARIFGDISDPESEISKLLYTNQSTVLKKEAGTKPHIYYIGADEDATRQVDVKSKALERDFIDHHGMAINNS